MRATCGACGHMFDTPRRERAGERTACPRCGSTARRIAAAVTLTATARFSLALKHWRLGVKKAVAEALGRWSFSRRRGVWAWQERVIDRERDRYHERVTDPAHRHARVFLLSAGAHGWRGDVQ